MVFQKQKIQSQKNTIEDSMESLPKKKEKKEKKQSKINFSKLQKNIEKQSKEPKVKKEKATTSQKTIKYKNMYENGICEIEKGLFSRTKKIDDINYQIAKRDEQIDIFTKYCTFLNYFDASTSLQITIHNRRVDEEDFKKQMLMDLKGNDLDVHRKEMNSILQNKAMEGAGQNILRDKYFTYTCEAETYEAAVSTLARIDSEIESNLKTIDCVNKTMSGIERLNLVNSMLNPNDKFDFEYRDLLYSNLSTRDYIAPSSFDFKDKSTFKFGNYYGSVLFAQHLPADLNDRFIRTVTDLPIDMITSMQIEAVENEKALDFVKTKISFMDQQKIDEIKKARKAGYEADMIPQELQYSLEEAKELRHELQQGSQRMFKATLLFFTYAEDEDTLKENVIKIISEARKQTVKVKTLDLMQEEGLNSILPLGKNHVPIKRTLTTSSTAIFIPFTTQELFDKGGIWYGLNALSRNMIFYDRKKLLNGNGWILGVPGGGKSFIAKEEMVQVILNTNDEVLVIDPEREYTPLANALDGEVIHISSGSKNYINPMDLSEDYGDTDDPTTLKAEFILSMCEILVGSKDGLSASQKSIITRAAILTYAEYFNSKNKIEPPTLKDFYKKLVEQPEEEAKGIALAIEMYVTGTLNVFSHQTNVNTSNRFTVYDIKDLGKQLRTLGMLIVLDQIWNRITLNRQKGIRTWIYIDEIYLLFANEYSANYLFELWKRARKWGAIPTGITQNVEDLLLSDQARRMLSNSEFILMLNQATSDREELARLLNISTQQLSYVTSAPAGQGLLFGGGNAVIPFVNQFPNNTNLYKLMTSKLEEVIAREAGETTNQEVKWKSPEEIEKEKQIKELEDEISKLKNIAEEVENDKASYRL